MARFNEKTTQKTEMLAGGQGFKMTPEMELYACTCASILTPQYYTPNTNDQINKIKTLIRKCDPVFVAQLAVYAREQMYLRTIPMVLTVELAKCHKGDNLLRRLSRRVIQRADEITELLAYYVKANGLQSKFVESKGGHNIEKKIYKLSNQLRKGVADAFFKFDEYQFAKYNRAGEIKLRDALFLTHPKPRTDAQKVLFEKIAQNNLSTPYTWETQLSKAGQEGKDKKSVWTELIMSGRMNYMSMLRNLRNFLDAEVSEIVLNKVADRIADPNEVRKSKQFPFRFLSAYRSIGGGPSDKYSWGDIHATEQHNNLFTPIILEALEKAVLISIENIPMLSNNTVLVATDVSASMQCTISEKSTIQNYDIGALLGMLVQARVPNSVIGMFGDTWKVLTDAPVENVLAATNEVHRREGEVGYATHGYKVLSWALDQKKVFDRIFYFTDGQMYGRGSRDLRGINEKWKLYKSTINPHAKLYLFNLGSYGQTPIDLKQDDVHMITGWNDKIFTILESIENGGQVLDEIKEITI
jgi:hypothetical protein